MEQNDAFSCYVFFAMLFKNPRELMVNIMSSLHCLFCISLVTHFFCLGAQLVPWTCLEHWNGQNRAVCRITDRGIYSWFKTPKFSAKIYLPPGGQRTGIKGKGRKKTDREEGEGNKSRGKKTREREAVFVLKWDKGLPLDRGEKDITHRKMVTYKAKMGKLCLDEGLILFF